MRRQICLNRGLRCIRDVAASKNVCVEATFLFRVDFLGVGVKFEMIRHAATLARFLRDPAADLSV